jgi:hypothetical protein
MRINNDNVGKTGSYGTTGDNYRRCLVKLGIVENIKRGYINLDSLSRLCFLLVLSIFLISSCAIDQSYYKSDSKCHYKRVRIYDEKGRYKGYTEERVCED